MPSKTSWPICRVPDGWQPDSEETVVVQEVKRKVSSYSPRGSPLERMSSCHGLLQDGAQRFCQKCQNYKPPRSHHCRVCQRCVLRMDHHCPWTNNCVGHRNYRTFLVFLLCKQSSSCRQGCTSDYYLCPYMCASPLRRRQRGFGSHCGAHSGPHRPCGTDQPATADHQVLGSEHFAYCLIQGLTWRVS